MQICTITELFVQTFTRNHCTSSKVDSYFTLVRHSWFMHCDLVVISFYVKTCIHEQKQVRLYSILEYHFHPGSAYANFAVPVPHGFNPLFVGKSVSSSNEIKKKISFTVRRFTANMWLTVDVDNEHTVACKVCILPNTLFWKQGKVYNTSNDKWPSL